MVRKGNKKDTKRSKSKVSVRPVSSKIKRPKPSAAVKRQDTPAQATATLNGLENLLSRSSMAICLFDKDDKITYCTEKFAALTGSSIESLIGKRLKKNTLWGARGGKDEFQEIYGRAKESGKPLTVDSLHVSSGKGITGIWNLTLLPQMDDGGDYNGMGLAIEDVSGNELPSGSADLFHRFYTAAMQHTDAQPLLEELDCLVKDFSRCDSVKILVLDALGNQPLKAETGIKPGLWDSDEALSATVINSFFTKKGDQSDILYTPGGSLYISDVNTLEGVLTNKLKEMVVNTCNSYGFNVLALVPVKLGDSICGFIQLANKNRGIAEDTIATVESISEQLQIIFERVALKREIRTQRESLLKQMHGRSAHLEALSERLKQEAAERKQVQEELRIRKDLAVALAGTEKIEDALQFCLDTAIRVAGMDSGGIYILDPTTGGVNLACSRGLSESFIGNLAHYEASERNIALVMAGKPLYSPEDIDIDDTSLIPSEGIKSLAVIPVMHQGKAIACLNIASHVFQAIPHAARNALEAVAAEIGSTIARVRDREALAESEGRYGILFAQSKNPVLLFDEGGNYIEGNEAALNFLECTREELLRMNVRDTLPPYLDDEWLAEYRKIWETGGRVERDYYVWGKIKVLELTITPLQMGGRKIVFGIGTDITERKRLEQELRQSEEKHRSILDQMLDSCYEIDLEGKYTYINDAMCRSLWYTREELIGKRYRLLVPEEDLDKVYKAFYEVYETGKPNIGFAHKIRRKDGIVGMAESSITLLKNERGEPVGFLCIARDITERIRLEEAAKHSEEKYSTILEEMDEAYAECDPKGNLIFVNDATCRQLGYTREELIGMNYKVFSSPEDIHERIRVFSRVFQTGEPEYWWPTQMISKDGTRIDVENSVFPLRNEKGEIVGLRVVRRNVTERKQMENALRQSEEKYRTILEEINDSYIEGDLKGMTVFFNDAACRNLGYSREEFAGTHFTVFTPAEDMAEVVKVYSEVISTGLPVYWHPFVKIKKDGTRSFVESSVFALRNEKGEITGTRTVSRNVTETKLAAQELEKRALMLDSAYDTIIAFDPGGKIVYANERAYRIRGYEPGELLGMNIRELVKTETVPALEERLAKILDEGELEFEATHVWKDGSTFMVEGRSTLINVAGQQIVVSGYTDITLRRKAEAALVESESKYRSLVESGGASIAIVDMDGKFAFVNDTLCRMAGYAKEELLGKEFLDFVHPEEREQDARLFREAGSERKTDIHIETRALAKDGHIIWFYTSPVELKINDRLVGFSVILQDITERKQAEEKIERLNLVLQAISLVNQLIVREKDRDNLLQQTCDSLVKNRGFRSASIVLLDGSGKYVTFKQAGLGEIAAQGLDEFVELLRQGDFPYCIKYVLDRSGPAEITDKTSQCVDCPLWAVNRGHPVMSARLAYNENVYGVLTVSLPEKIILDKEEMELVGEVSGDIAFALYNIDLEEEKEKWDEALHESEEHFRSLAEESPDMIFIHDTTRIVYANKLCEEVMGYPREEMYSESFDFIKLIAPEYKDKLRESFAAHKEGKEVPQIEYALLTRNGSWIDALINTRLITYSGRPAILGVVTEVTEMRRIEHALLETENKYRIILEEANEAYFEIDAKGNITFVNDAACRHLGYPREELVGLNYKAITVPEDLHSRVEIWGEVFRTGVPRHRVEYKNVRKDGSIFYAECSIFPLHDQNGNIIGLRTVAQDITRRRQAEDELRKSEEKYRTILEEMDESYFEVDLKENVTFLNDACRRRLGYAEEGAIGLNYKACTPPDEIREKARIYSEVVRTGTPVYWQLFTTLRKDGTPFFSEACIFPLRNEKGEVIGLRALARDVTESRLAEQELQKRAFMLDSAYDSIIAFNTEGKIVYANERACQTRGYELDEMLKMNVVDLMAEEDIPAIDSRILTVIEKGSLEFEAVHKRKDGSTFAVEGRSRLIEVAGQKIIVSGYTDITLRKKAEKALMESESKYRSLVESGGAGIATADVEGRIEFVNDTLCSMLGYPRQELLGRYFNDFMLPGERDRLRAIYLEAVQSKKTGIQMEFRAAHRDGHILWLSTTPAELRYENQVVGYSAIVQNVTERKRAEEIARQSEEKYGTILEEIDEHYAEIDAKGNFIFVNEAMCRGFGYSREEMIGMNYKTYTPQEDIKHRLKVFSEVFKTGKPIYWQLFEDLVKDGSRRLVEISIFPLKDNKGEIVGLRTIGRDVTDRRKAEAKLRKSEERYRLLAENSLDVIFTTDMDLRLNYVSPSVKYLVGISWDEILKTFSEQTLKPEFLGLSLRDANRFQQCLKALIEDPSRSEVFEFAVKHRDGYIKWAEVQMSVMRDKFGQSAGALGVIRDISQQKKMTERLVSADRLASLGEMAAGLAHEVNNPLTAVMGFSYLLLQNQDTPEDVRSDVEAIYKEGNRAAEIIRNFLTFARGQKPEKQAIFINDILQEVLNLRHNRMEKENIRVVFNLTEDLPAVQGDVSQLQQVFLNLILNAEYFMYRTNRGGTLTVNTKLEDGKVIAVIADDGPGIVPEAISRIFDPFYTTKDVGEGTGLGLSICHGIVMEHGGTIYAESEAGKGASLTVELPVR